MKPKLSSESYIIAIIVIVILISTVATLVYVYVSILSPHSSSTTKITTSPHIVTPKPELTFLNSSFLNDTIPLNMKPGQKYNVSIISKNTGDVSWSTVKNIMIAPLMTTDAELFGNSSPIEQGQVIKKGINYTWKFTIIAPSLNGNYTLKYQMKNNSSWFGDILVKNVTVGNPGDVVDFVTQDIKYYPSILNKSILSMGKNNWLNVSITAKNMGRNNWSQADNVSLEAIDYESNDAAKFNPQTIFYVAPGSIVLPGQQCSWTFKFHAPDYPGSYQVKYRMIRNGQWFGSPIIVTIVVK